MSPARPFRAASGRRRRLASSAAAVALIAALAACGGPEAAPVSLAPVVGDGPVGTLRLSAAERFFVRADFHRDPGLGLAARATGADLWFFADAAGQPPSEPVTLEHLQVIMPCCHSEPAIKPRWFASPAQAHRVEVVDICPSRSGRWELRLRARLGDGPSDESVIDFVAD